ncbi:hypothetical protein HU200_014164 [Digitaria exilis]|uniref:F-box domain-containing protein n=1 Tax=Digitaria exilis TaxID=1010633 RepID=A0A835FCF7_9POAL|nr:hypothetical protein HU200_014164 [Digitaria exilis]
MPLEEERHCRRSCGSNNNPYRSPPELVDDNIDEILVRLSPEDPALLVHASTVSKSWRNTLTNCTFASRYREFHRTPPVLGIFRRDGILIPTTSFLPPAVHHFNCHVLDYRHGRVLLENLDCGEIVPDHLALVTNGAVLCAMDTGCDHLNCHDGPFRVALVGADPEGQLHACVYSSETDEWSPHTSLDVNDDIPPEFLANAYLAFIDEFYNKILRYDPMEPSLSVIETPVKETCDDGVIVMREEDGGLGFTFIKANSLHLWSMRKDRNGKPQWTNFRAIELEKLLPVGKMSPQMRTE